METMGERIKRLRLAADMTQTDLAKLLGLQKTAIVKYENGAVENIKRGTIKKMSDIFGVSPVYLLCLEDYEAPSPAEKINEGERVLLDLFRSLSDEKKEMVIAMLRAALQPKG